jgi:hypothetical protein
MTIVYPTKNTKQNTVPKLLLIYYLTVMDKINGFESTNKPQNNI